MIDDPELYCAVECTDIAATLCDRCRVVYIVLPVEGVRLLSDLVRDRMAELQRQLAELEATE